MVCTHLFTLRKFFRIMFIYFKMTGNADEVAIYSI